MTRQIRLTLIILNTGLIFLLGLIFFLFSVGIIVNQARERGYSDIEQIYANLTRLAVPETAVQGMAVEGTDVDFQQIVLNQSAFIPARIIIVDQDSRLLADSRLTTGKVSGLYIDADIIEARRTGNGGSTVRSPRSGALSVSAALKKEWKDRWIIISLIYEVDHERHLLLSFSLLLFILIILISTLILQLTGYTRRSIKNPLKNLISHTRDVAGGGFFKISFDSTDLELNQLVENFNLLIDRYNLLIESDNRKYSRINTLLSNLRTGILMVDTENAVTLVNPEAERLLHLNKLHLFHVRDDALFSNTILEEILEHTQSISRDNPGISYSAGTGGGGIIDVTIEMMIDKYEPYAPGGALVILRDVTEMRRLERLKDEFVSNVSHELRTPLTVISGFVETLKSWELLSLEDRSTALNIIEVETERLKKLISELLLLSRIEGEMGHAKKRLINCPDAVNQVASTLMPLAKKKSLQIILEIDPEVKPLFGIAGWFRQIAYNLLDNAIKYTPEGGEIRIRLMNTKAELRLEVEDSGTGIPENEKERIFERFYRKDKSRNSRIAGSGIGLTITRHMVAEFEGSIEVRDRQTGGSVFIVTLPWRKSSTNEIENDEEYTENET